MPSRASDNWNGFGKEGPGSDSLHQQVQTVLTTANFQYLQGVAMQTRHAEAKPPGPDCNCTIDTARFTYGHHHVVVEIAFSDQVYWLARIRHSPIDGEYGTHILSEIATMETLRSRTTIPVPRIFGFAVSCSNELGFPYILMEALPGRILEGQLAKTVPPSFRPKVATQIAEVLFQLQNLSFNHLGRIWRGEQGDESLEIIPTHPKSSPPPSTSLEWFYNERQEANRQAMAQHAGDKQWISACWILKAAVSHIIIEDRVNGPFPLCHPDLHYGNILFDEDFDITGILDWEGAQTVPLERLAISPEFITYPGLSPEENQETVDFRNLVHTHLQNLDRPETKLSLGREGPKKTYLSDIFGTKASEITYRCTYSFPHRTIYDARLVAALIYGSRISWEQLVDVYGEIELI